MALNRIPVPPDPKRDEKARELVKGWRLWPVKTLKRDEGAFKRGDQFFVINGHDTSAVYCSCKDYQKRGAICGHIRAVVMLDRQSVTRTEQPAEPLFPRCRSCNRRSDYQPCDDCCAAETRRLETAGKAALAGSRYARIFRGDD